MEDNFQVDASRGSRLLLEITDASNRPGDCVLCLGLEKKTKSSQVSVDQPEQVQPSQCDKLDQPILLDPVTTTEDVLDEGAGGNSIS